MFLYVNIPILHDLYEFHSNPFSRLFLPVFHEKRILFAAPPGTKLRIKILFYQTEISLMVISELYMTMG
jgi:hypothetical protein